MKHSIILTIFAAFSFNAFADLKVSNVDGWVLNYVKDDNMIQYVIPGAEYALTKTKKEGEEADGMAITIRKIEKLTEEKLTNNKKAWLSAMYSPDRLKKTTTRDERQAVLKVDGQWRFVSEQEYNTGVETPLSEAVMGTMIGGDLYLVQYQHRGGVFQRNKKEALQLLKKIKIEVVAKEAASKTE